MPTGYTADVESGKLTDFRTFALRCARAFGACVMQREDGIDVLPEHRKPSSYHLDAIESAKKELARLSSLTPAEIEKESGEEYQRSLTRFREGKARVQEQNARYDAMAEKVKAWKPPTPEHENLKKFMLEQLEMSVHCITPGSYYFSEPKPQRPGDWLKDNIEWRSRDVAYHTKEHQEELDRCAQANAWIDALYESLKP